MDLLTLLLIAVSLSMDALAVSVSSGMSLCLPTPRAALRIAGSFGLFQGLMPWLGYTAARVFAGRIEAVDHWVAFGLLALVGGRMVREALSAGDETAPAGDPSRWRVVLVMAVATSIDALAVGASFAVLPAAGLLALRGGTALCCGIIAAVTLVLCFAGVHLGWRFGNLFGNKAELAGGAALFLIGGKILLQDLLGF